MAWYAYYFPCFGEDHCKLGFSHDPLQRIRSLHRRWYEFFDVDRGLLIETETERDARDIELILQRPVRLHNAPMPLTIETAAGGFTEWYRGASGHVTAVARALSEQDYAVHAPMSGWLREALTDRLELLYEWTSAQRPLLEADNVELRRLQPLLDELDTYPALSIPLADALPEDIFAWYARARSVRGMNTA